MSRLNELVRDRDIVKLLLGVRQGDNEVEERLRICDEQNSFVYHSYTTPELKSSLTQLSQEIIEEKRQVSTNSNAGKLSPQHCIFCVVGLSNTGRAVFLFSNHYWLYKTFRRRWRRNSSTRKGTYTQPPQSKSTHTNTQTNNPFRGSEGALPFQLAPLYPRDVLPLLDRCPRRSFCF